MATEKKEGWLVKNNQKRYFVLSDDVLTWFSHPMGSTKGSLELRNYYVETHRKPAGDYELVLTPSKQAKVKDLKTYRLTGVNPDDISQWASVFEKVIKYRCLKQDDNLTKQGWLEKKGKRRWFLLKDEIIYWFNKEQFLNSDFMKSVNGSLELASCTILPPPQGSNTFVFTIQSRTQGSYALAAKSKVEMDEWINVLKQAAEKGLAKKNERLEHISAENNPDKKAYLMKKGKRRFFVLKDGILSWYLTDKEDKLKGKLVMSGCTIALNTDKKNNSFTITPGGGGHRVYELIAKMPQEAEEWTLALTQATHRLPNLKTHHVAAEELLHAMRDGSKEILPIDPNSLEKRGWLMKKGKRRYFILKKDLLSWFTDEQPKEAHYNLARGNLTLTGCTVEKNFHEFSFSLKSSVARHFVLTAKTVNEVTEWVDMLQKCIQYASERSKGEPTSPRLSGGNSQSSQDEYKKEIFKKGWLIKKGLARWFELSDDTLRWFEAENAPYEKLKGSLAIYNCSVTETARDSFIVSSPQGKSYIMQANTEEEKQDWIRCLQQGILHANQLMDMGFEKKGWLEKKGQKRWFILKQTKLMWFAQQQPFENIVLEKANNSLDILECLFKINPTDPTSFDVEDAKRDNHHRYTLKARSDSEAQAWVSALIQAKSNRGRAALGFGGKGKVFGVRLDQLEMNTTQPNVPLALEMMTDFLCQYGLFTQGIFRLSCSAERRAELKEAFDKDPHTVQLQPDETDVHVVAALLKGLLRELPEPVLPFHLYSPLLQASNDKEKIKQMLQSLPEINQNVMKHLFKFIRAVSTHANVNQMNDSNLSIVFGPNLLRPQETTMIGGFADTPYILSFILTLTTNYEYFFA